MTTYAEEILTAREELQKQIQERADKIPAGATKEEEAIIMGKFIKGLYYDLKKTENSAPYIAAIGSIMTERKLIPTDLVAARQRQLNEHVH